jgi:chromosome segregation ATPase
MIDLNRDTLYRMLHDLERDLQDNEYDIIRAQRRLHGLQAERQKIIEAISEVKTHIKHVEQAKEE